MKEKDGGMEWWEQGEKQGMNRNTHWDPAVHSSRCMRVGWGCVGVGEWGVVGGVTLLGGVPICE